MTGPDVILFPGLGADAELFKKQTAHFGSALRVPRFLDPKPDETLEDFAIRTAEALASEIGADTLVRSIIGGFSFGGMLAQEIARRTRVGAVALLAGLPSHEAVTPGFRAQVQALRVLPDPVVRAGLLNVGVRFVAGKDRLDEADTESLRAMARRVDLGFFRWSSRAASLWTGEALPQSLGIPVRHLHGRRDPIIPVPATHEPHVEWLEDGGHLIVYTHGAQVNAWLEQLIRSVRTQR